MTTAELGVGPAVARFTSLNATHPDRPRQILFGALGLYLTLGLVVVATCYFAAGAFVDLFSVPDALRDDAIETLQIIGWVTFAALIAGVLGHVLTGFERFTAFTWSNVLGSVVFLATLVVLLRDDPRLQDPALAALLQWTVVAVLRVGLLRGVLLGRGPRRLGRALLREMFGFSARLQASVAATLVNTQTDRVVIGAVSSTATLGQAGVATQVADAGRFLGYAAFAPIMSRMAVEYGTGGATALDPLYTHQRRLWTSGLLGATAVGVGAVHPAITAWLGPGLEDAALFASLLIAAYGIGLLPNPEFGYLRAVGRPGLEGLFGVVTVVVNIVATVVLGLLFGAVGVVAATAAAYAISTLWIMRRTRSVVPSLPRDVRALFVVCVAAALASATTYLAGELLVAHAPRLAALAGVIATAGVVFVVYLRVVTDLRPLRTIRRGFDRAVP